jgi:hypothetical protein
MKTLGQIDFNHIVKIEGKFLDQVLTGAMSYQIRFNDRNYKEGQTIKLAEWNGEAFVKRSSNHKIGFVSDINQQFGWVVFSLLPVEGGAA